MNDPIAQHIAESPFGDQPTPVMDELAKALASLRWKRERKLKLDDAYEWLESAVVDVLDLYKPEGE